jgi:SAM-dependent methyltransferase
MNTDLKKHWNKIYDNADITGLGWYEPDPQQSLSLIEMSGVAKDASILDAGCGATTLIDRLLDAGYTNLTAVDISAAALQRLQERLGPERAAMVRWIEDDLSAPQHLQKIRNVALWHDRAVLHFLIDNRDRQTYRETLMAALQPGGFVIIAAFAVGGAQKCSGLPVHNYDEASLAEWLGSGFELLHSTPYLYHTPSGAPRPYIYTLFRRKK